MKKQKAVKENSFTFPPQEEVSRVLKRISQPGYRRVNVGLLPNATESDKAKFLLCKSILRYEQDNNISEEELREKLGINQSKLEYILFGHINKTNLEDLINYLGKLHIPYELKINNQYGREASSQTY